MESNLKRFETIARSLARLPERQPATLPSPESSTHPFETRNIHTNLPLKVRELFDDGHFAEATFHAFKFLDKEVQRHSGLAETGEKLMMTAFNMENPKVKLTALSNETEKDEQRGFRFIFAGGVSAIRNPRGHEYTVVDAPETCLDHLSFVSMLLRKLEAAGFKPDESEIGN